MRLSEKGQDFIITREGVRNKVYKDSAGLPTIGVGHLLTKSELSSGKIIIEGQQIVYRNGLTDAQVAALLSQDITPFETTVSERVKVPLNQNQFDALVSLVFNIGSRAFSNSTLLKRLNAGAFAEMPAQFMRWVYAGGRKTKGLVTRRELEVKLWKGEL